MTTLTPDMTLFAQLERLVQRGRVLRSPAQLAGYDADGLGFKSYRPDAVVIPADADELLQVMRNLQPLGVPVCLRGAGTSLSGGPVAAQGGVIVHTSSLRAVRRIDPDGFWCEVESGVTLNRLDQLLQPFGLFYPPDPSSGPVCTLGGNVAMNAGGAHCFRYGVTSNYVLGVEAVLADGSVRQFGGPAGGRGNWRDDWLRLMVGSEGTLAAFTRFWLRLLPRPEKAWTFRATFRDLTSAEQAIHRLVADPSFPAAIELMDPRCVAMVENSPMAVGLPTDAFLLVTEIDGPPQLVDRRVQQVAQLLHEAGAADVQFSDDEQVRGKLWRARKVAGGLMGQLSPDLLVQDAVIPKQALAELLRLIYDEADAVGVPVVNVFHAGDGNLHPNFLFDSRQPGQLEQVEAVSKRLMQRVVEVGGTLSGEHGIGNDKSAYMPLVFGERTLRLQLAVPAAFNPRHQLNPLKVFQARRFDPSCDPGCDPSRDLQEDLAGDPRRTPATAAVCRTTPDSAATADCETAGAAGPVGAAAAGGGSPDARLFTHFLDPVDGVLCVSSDATPSDVDALAGSQGWRFPLVLDDRASLRDHLASSPFAPASSRFGPYVDNLIGMNWRLPGGQVVRIGERVVKSTTGYDLHRFLLGSQGSYGHPVDFVLRLRPACEITGLATLSGTPRDVTQAAAHLLRTCWMHWYDSVDVLVDGTERLRLRIAANCPRDEWSIHVPFLASLAESHRLAFETALSDTPPWDGCPDFVLKTTPDRVISLADEVARAGFAGDLGFGSERDQAGPIRCVGLCYSGVVHGYLQHAPDVRNAPDAHGPREWRESLRELLQSFETRLLDSGGSIWSRHLVRPLSGEAEAAWCKVLEREFAR